MSDYLVVRDLKNIIRRLDGDTFVLISDGDQFRFPREVVQTKVVKVGPNQYKQADLVPKDFDELTTGDKTPLVINAIVLK